MFKIPAHREIREIWEDWRCRRDAFDGSACASRADASRHGGQSNALPDLLIS